MWTVSSGDTEGVKLPLALSVGQGLGNFFLKTQMVNILGLRASLSCSYSTLREQPQIIPKRVNITVVLKKKLFTNIDSKLDLTQGP